MRHYRDDDGLRQWWASPVSHPNRPWWWYRAATWFVDRWHRWKVSARQAVRKMLGS